MEQPSLLVFIILPALQHMAHILINTLASSLMRKLRLCIGESNCGKIFVGNLLQNTLIYNK